MQLILVPFTCTLDVYYYCSIYLLFTRDQADNLLGGICNSSSWSKDSTAALCFLQKEIVILGWDDATSDYEHMASSLCFQFRLQGWEKCLMSSCLRRYSNHVHIAINGLNSYLFRRREKWTDVDIKSEIRKSAGNYLGSAIVSILTNLRN